VNRALLPLVLALPLGCRGTFDIGKYIADGESGDSGTADTQESATTDASETRADETTDTADATATTDTDTNTETETDTDTDTSTDTDVECSFGQTDLGIVCIGLRQIVQTGASSDIEVASFGDDELLDLLVAVPVAYYAGLPGGVFSEVGAPVVLASGPRLASVDWNLDGHLDFLALSDAQLELFIADGPGNYSGSTTYVGGGFDAVFSDFNDDNLIDIVTSGPMLRVYRNDFNNVLIPVLTMDQQAEAIVIGDLDGDEYRDIALAMTSMNQIGVILTLPNFEFPNPITFPLPELSDVAIADIDDIPGSEVLAVAGVEDPGVLFVGKVVGAAIMSVGAYDVGIAPKTVAVGDIDGDSVNDVAVGNFSSHDVSVLLGAGGLLSDEIRLPVDSVEDFPHQIAVADLEGDGKAEIIVAMTNSERVLVYGTVP
jgi:hypothetical protein